MKKNYLFLILILIGFSKISLSQTEDEEFRKMHEYMQERMKKIQQSLFSNDDFFSDDFPDLLKDMDDQLNNSGPTGSISTFGASTIEYYWKNEKDKRILVVKKPNDNSPVNISIENNMINLTASISKKSENGTYHSKVSSSLNVPKELDDTKVDIQDKGNSIEVIFPYKSDYSNAKPVRKIIQNQVKPLPKQNSPEKRPIEPKKGDITL